MTIVRATDVAFHYPSHSEDLFHKLNLVVSAGDRIGLVGQNGAGKSTLCHLLSGDLIPTSGSVTYPAKVSVGWCDQQIGATMPTVAHLFEAKGYDIYDPKLMRALGKWQVEFARLFDHPTSWSGGEQVRAMLATALMMPPDLLILDEPTNHLDHVGILQLREALETFKGGLIVISHHREFLDLVTHRTWSLENQKLCEYDTSISPCLEIRGVEQRERVKQKQILRQKVENLEMAHRRKVVEAKRMENFKEQRSRKKNGGICKRDEGSGSAMANPGKVMTQAKVLGDKIHRIKAEIDGLDTKVIKSHRLHWNVEGARKARYLLWWDDETVSIPGVSSPLLAAIRLRIENGDRIAFVGPNGCGKSLMVEKIYQWCIEREWRVGFLRQKLNDLLNQTVEEYLGNGDRLQLAKVLRLLGALHVPGERRQNLMGHLSPGERSKVEIAKLMGEEPEVLILDEPTNHLSMIDLLALEEALKNYPGTLIVVSHDRAFIDQLGCRIFDVEVFNLVQDSRVIP